MCILRRLTPGQTYSGVFAGSDGANFFFRAEQNRVLVGNLKDLESEPHPGDKVTLTAA